MPKMTSLKEIIDYPYAVRSLVLQDHDVMALLSNDPEYDPDGDMAEQFENRVKDHDYVDETTLTANAYIVIESEMVRLNTPTMATMYVYVTIIISKKFMDLDPKTFKGYKGNRRDNIAMSVHKLLEKNRDFGIGDLRLISATIGSVPSDFTSRILTYEVPTIA